MKKIFLITIVYFLSLILNRVPVKAEDRIISRILSNIDNRRINMDTAINSYSNSQINDQSLTQFITHDLQQAKLNSGRLFIRDKIIFP